MVNNSGEIKGKKQWNPRNNDPTPAPPWTGDLEGETIVRDLVDTLSHISKWEDVKVAPELSAQEKKKLEARRRHEAKLAEQRRLKAARQAAHNNRGGRGGSSRSYGRGGGGGGRNRGGRGGGGGWGHNRGNQNWNSMQKGGGARGPMAAAGPAVDPTRGTKSSKAIRVDITLNTRVNARTKRKESSTQPQGLPLAARSATLKFGTSQFTFLRHLRRHDELLRSTEDQASRRGER